jgi:hypothetical protein
MLDPNKALDDLLFTGSVVDMRPLLDGKVQVEFTSLTPEKRLAAEKAVSSETTANSTQMYATHLYMIKLLSQSLTKFEYKGKVSIFDTAEQAEQFLKSRPEQMLGLIAKEHSIFEKEISSLITNEKLENFSPVPSI